MKNYEDNVSQDKLNEYIDNFINTNKFQTNLNTLIANNLSNRSLMGQPRSKLIENILSNEYIKDVEKEILANMFETFKVKVKDEFNLNFRANKKVNIKQGKLESKDNENKKHLEILISKILKCNDEFEIENYIGELSNFDSFNLQQSNEILEVLKVISKFLLNSCEKDVFLISNIISFVNKLIKISNTKILVETTLMFLKYLNALVEKFYLTSFDITKFYKLSVNVECLNNILLKFFDDNIHLRRINEDKIKVIVNSFLSLILKNYDVEKSLLLDHSNSTNKDSSEFGLSTNYILLLFFCLDNDLCAFKIMFRNSSLRKYIKDYDFKLKHLIFVDFTSCISLMKKKHCFLWKHPAILEKVYSNQKISKKYLIYCWTSIQLHFLGLYLRFNILRKRLYSSKIKCNEHFSNLVNFIEELISNGESYSEFLESTMIENIFYLVKEILCDFILYCLDNNCIKEKYDFIKKGYLKVKAQNFESLKLLYDDLLLAFQGFNDVLA